MDAEPNLTAHKPLTDGETPRYHVHGSAFAPGDRLRWLFDFTITAEAADDAGAQQLAFDVFTEYDIDISEIEDAPPCE